MGEYDLVVSFARAAIMRQTDGLRKYLYHKNDQLYSHMWDGPNNRFEREDFWGVGNGWTAAGLTRVIKLLPDNRLEGS